MRIGTVDSFQGREAAVVFYSMATSSGEDARATCASFQPQPPQRRVSRARCLAYLVCAPALLRRIAKTLEQMRLISTLCALSDVAGEQIELAA